MAKTVAIQKPLLNTYHQNSSLLFQFILSEFLIANAEMQKICQLCHVWKLSQNDCSDEPTLCALAGLITNLVGYPAGQMRIFTWTAEAGTLTKLKNYSSYLQQCEKKESKLFLSLDRQAHRCWMQGSKLSDNLTTLQIYNKRAMANSKGKVKHATDFANEICKIIDKLKSSINTLAGDLIKTVYKFRNDENVIYFLVDRYKEFDAVYGSGFTEKLLENLFKKGLSEACFFLQKKYLRRGFSHMEQLINLKMASLKANSPYESQI